MKKLLLLTSILVSALSFGQINKKDLLLGGTFGIYYSSNNSQNQYSQSNSNISPFFQYAYKQNRTIGFSLLFNYASTNSDGNKQKTTGLGPEFNLTQYHPIKSKFGWYLQEQLGGGYQSNVNENTNGDVSKTSTGYVYLGARPGVYFLPGNEGRWLLFGNVGGAQVGYQSQKDGPESWAFDINLFRYYQFGFSYIFRK